LAFAGKQKTKSKFYCTTNILSLAFQTQININFETINYSQGSGLEFGLSHYSPNNIYQVANLVLGGGYTKTFGGIYGTDQITPTYTMGHKGIGMTANYKIYFEDYSVFIGPQINIAFLELKDGFYQGGNSSNYDGDRGFYWYRANHFLSRAGLLLNFGYCPNTIKASRFEFGFAFGANFNFGRLEIQEWGYHRGNEPPVNNADLLAAFPNYKKTKNTDGFFIKPAMRLFIKFGLGFKKYK
jgi:hypothetical protein